MNLSATINAMYADPNRDEFAFWTHIKSYVGKLVNPIVTQDLIDETVQDVLIQIIDSMDRFKAVDVTSFTRWISGIAWRRASTAVRDQYRAKEIPNSQIGTLNDQGVWEPYDLASLEVPISDDVYNELLDRELKDERNTKMLDDLRTRIQADHLPLFDALRSGLNKTDATRQTGVNYTTALHRIKSWRKLAAKKGNS